MSKSILSNASDFNIRLDLSNTVASGIAAVLNEVNIDTTSIDDKNSVIITGIGGINTHLDTLNTTVSGQQANASVSTSSDVVLVQSVSDDGEKTPAGNIFGNAVHTTVSGINKADATADSDTDVYRVQLINELGDKIGLAPTEPVFTNTAVSNPPWEQDTYVELADETGGTDGEHDYYIDIEGYPKNCVEYDLSSSVSLALQGTIQNDGTEPESCRYHNVEDLYVGTPTFSGVDAGLVYTSGSAPNFKYLRLRVTAATGDDSGNWFLAVNKFMV